MDFDNDKLKELFSEGDPGLPPAFGWEQMEEGIMEKMAALDATRPPSRRINNKVIRGIAILLLCLVPVLFFNNGRLLEMAGFQGQGHPSKNQAEATGQAANPSPAAQPLGSDPNPSSEAAPKKSVPAAALPQQGATGQPATKAGSEAFGKEKIKLERLSRPAEQSRVEGDAFVPGQPAAADKLPAAAPPAAPVVPNRVSPASTRVLSSENAPIAAAEDRQEQSPLALLPSLPVKVLTAQTPVEATLAGPVVRPAKNRRLIPAQQWSMLSGISDWAVGYAEAPHENAPYEQTALSYYTQLSYTRRLGNNYTLTAGLQYQQLEAQLAWSQRIEDYTSVTIRDTIVEIQVNSLTGNRTVVRGDVEVSVDAVRNVRHHNRYRLVQVPIAIGKSWRIGGRWQTDLAVGGAINVLAHNQGRSIYQGELQRIDGPATRTIDNRWGLHGLAMARFGYRLNERMGILLEVQYQKSLTNWSSVPNLQMKPRIFNLGLGACYTL
jgi:hypothetical protein